MQQKLITIAITVALLVSLLVMKQRCGVAMVGLFRAIDAPSTDGGSHD